MNRDYLLQQATYWQRGAAMYHRHAVAYLAEGNTPDAIRAQAKGRISHGTSVDYLAMATYDARLEDERTATLYQVIGALASAAGVFEDPAVIRALDLAAYGKTEDGRDVLPFLPEYPAVPRS